MLTYLSVPALRRGRFEVLENSPFFRLEGVANNRECVFNRGCVFNGGCASVKGPPSTGGASSTWSASSTGSVLLQWLLQQFHQQELLRQKLLTDTSSVGASSTGMSSTCASSKARNCATRIGFGAPVATSKLTQQGSRIIRSSAIRRHVFP
jgi:hypothetical protein